MRRVSLRRRVRGKGLYSDFLGGPGRWEAAIAGTDREGRENMTAQPLLLLVQSDPATLLDSYVAVTGWRSARSTRSTAHGAWHTWQRSKQRLGHEVSCNLDPAMWAWSPGQRCHRAYSVTHAQR